MFASKIINFFLSKEKNNLHNFGEKFLVSQNKNQTPSGSSETAKGKESPEARKEREEAKAAAARKEVEPGIMEDPERFRKDLDKDLYELTSKDKATAQATYEKILRANIIDNDNYGQLIGPRELKQLIDFSKKSEKREENDKLIIEATRFIPNNQENIEVYSEYFKDNKEALTEIGNKLYFPELSNFIVANKDSKFKSELFKGIFINDLKGQEYAAESIDKEALDLLLKENKEELDITTKAALLNNPELDEKLKEKFAKEISEEMKDKKEAEIIKIVKIIRDKEYKEKVIAGLIPEIREKLLEKPEEKEKTNALKSANIEIADPKYIEEISEREITSILDYKKAVEESLAKDPTEKVVELLLAGDKKLLTELKGSEIKEIYFNYQGKEKAFRITWTADQKDLTVEEKEALRKYLDEARVPMAEKAPLRPEFMDVDPDSEEFEDTRVKRKYTLNEKINELIEEETFQENWESITGHETIEDIFVDKFHIPREEVPATMEDIITEYWNDEMDFEDFLNIVGKKAEENPEIRCFVFDEEISSDVDEFTDAYKEAYEAGDKETLKELEAIYTGGIDIIELMSGATVLPENPEATATIAEEKGYQIVGKFDGREVYTDKEGKSYLANGKAIEDASDSRRKAAEASENFEKAKEKAKETSEKREGLEGLLEEVKTKIPYELAVVRLSGDKIEISYHNTEWLPKFYLEKVEGRKNIFKLSYRKPPVMRTVEKATTLENLATTLKNERETLEAEIQETKKFARIDERNFDLTDAFKDFPIYNKSIQEFSDEDWMNNWNKVDNKAVFEGILSGPNFNIDITTVPMALREMVRPGSVREIAERGSDINFDDIIIESKRFSEDPNPYKDAESFVEEFKDLRSRHLELIDAEREGKLTTEGAKEKEEIAADLEKRYEFYFASMKLIKALQDTAYSSAPELTEAERYSSHIERAGRTDIREHGPFYKINGTEIALSKDANEAFRAEYSKFKNGAEYPEGTTQPQIIEAILKSDDMDVLIAEGVIKRAPSEKGETKLMIVKLPESFKAGNKGAKIMMEEGLGEGAELSSDSVAEARENLSKSYDTYKDKVEGLFMPAFQTARDELTFWDAEFRETERDTEEEYAAAKEGYEVFNHTVPEAMATHIVNLEKTKIKDENGNEKEIEVTKFNQKTKVREINEPALVEYLNYLIRTGIEKQAKIDALGKEGVDIKAEVNKEYPLRKITLKEGQSLMDIELSEEASNALSKGYYQDLEVEGKRYELALEKAKEEEMKKAKEKVKEGKEIGEDSPIVKQIQEMLKEAGAPPTTIENVHSKLVFGLGAAFRGDKFKGAGIGVGIDLGDGFALGVSTEGGVGAAVNLNLYKSDDTGLTFSPAVGYDGNINFAIPLTGSVAITDDLDAFATVAYSVTSGKFAVGGGIDFNEARATRNAIEKINKSRRYDEIDKIESPKAKADKIREILLKDLEVELDDAEVLTLYDDWKTVDMMRAMKESDPMTPITAVGAGVLLSPGYAGVFMGVKLRIGSSVVYKPIKGEREKMAKYLSQKEINEMLDEKLRRPSPEGVTLLSFESPSLRLRGDGEIGVLKESSETEIVDSANIENIRKELQDINLDAKIKTIQGVETLELSIFDDKDKDMRIFVDRKAEDLGLKYTIDGKLTVPSTAKDLVISRETFEYNYPKIEGGAVMDEIIVITTKDQLPIDREKIMKSSGTYLESTWENGKRTGWNEKTGELTTAKSRFEELNKYTERTGKEGLEKLKYVTRLGFSKDKYNRMMLGTSVMGENFDARSFESVNKLPSRFDGEEGKVLAEKLFKTIGWRLRAYPKPTGIPINNPEKVINYLNKKLTRKGGEKLNDKEAGQIYSYVLHRYFVNIWKERKGDTLEKQKERVDKAFERHSNRLKGVLLKRFRKGKDIPGVKSSPENMTKAVLEEVKKNFDNAWKNAKIENGKLTGVETTEIPKDFWVDIGSTYRGDGSRIEVGGPLAFTMPGIDKMNFLGDLKRWEIREGATELERDIATVLLETGSPRPSMKDAETLHQPLALKLANSEATWIKLGDKNYEELSEFYRLDKKSQKRALKRKGTEMYKAVEAFVAFANEVREIQLKGGGEYELENNVILYIGAPEVYSGAYGKCGNISNLVHEGFRLDIKGKPGEILTAKSKIRMPEKLRMRKTVHEIALGIFVAPEEKPDIPPEEEKGKKAEEGPGGGKRIRLPREEGKVAGEGAKRPGTPEIPDKETRFVGEGGKPLTGGYKPEDTKYR